MSQAPTNSNLSQVSGAVTGAAISGVMPWVAGGIVLVGGLWWFSRNLLPDVSGLKDAGQTVIDTYTDPFEKIAAKKEAEAKKAAEKTAEREKKKEDLDKAVEDYNKKLEDAYDDLDDDEDEETGIKWNQAQSYAFRSTWHYALGGSHPGQSLFADAWNNARKRSTALEQWIDDIDAARKAAGRMNLDYKKNSSAYGFYDANSLVKGIKSGKSGHWVRWGMGTESPWPGNIWEVKGLSDLESDALKRWFDTMPAGPKTSAVQWKYWLSANGDING